MIMDVDGLPPTSLRVNRYYTWGLDLSGHNGKPRPEPPAAGPRSGLADAAIGLARGAFAELDGVCESGAVGSGNSGGVAGRAARCAVRRGLMAEANGSAIEAGVEPARSGASAEGEKGKQSKPAPLFPRFALPRPRGEDYELGRPPERLGARVEEADAGDRSRPATRTTLLAGRRRAVAAPSRSL